MTQRVLQVISGLRCGGAERFLFQLVDGLAQRGLETQIVSLLLDDEALSAYGAPAVRVVRMDFQDHPFKSLKALSAELLAFRPHVVHAHMFHALCASLICCSRVAPRDRPRVVFTSHRSEYSMLQGATLLATRRFRSADLWLGGGAAPYWSSRRCTREVVNGVSVSASMPARELWSEGGGVRFLFVGRLIPDKDCEGLIMAFARARVPGSTLTIIGKGPREQDLHRLVESMELKHRVELLGFRTDTAAQMLQHDILLVHSKTEGMPLSVLEAGAQAMPVLSTPVGSIPRLLADGAGLVATPDAFSTAMESLVAKPCSAQAMGVTLYRKVLKNYTIDSTIEDHVRIYRDVCGFTPTRHSK